MSDFLNLGDLDDFIAAQDKITYEQALTIFMKNVITKLKNNTLLVLELNEARLTSEHIKLLNTGLIKNSSLRILSLSYNKLLNDEDITSVLQATINHSNLLELDISNIGFTNNVSKSISQFIENNKHLLFLDISENQLNDVGIIPIATALQTNHSIMGVNLPTLFGLDNYSASKALIKSVQQSNCLSFLSVGGYGLLSEHHATIKQILQRNRIICRTATSIPKNLFDYLQETRGFGWSIIQRDGGEVPILEILKIVDNNFKKLQMVPREGKENVENISIPQDSSFKPAITFSPKTPLRKPFTDITNSPNIFQSPKKLIEFKK